MKIERAAQIAYLLGVCLCIGGSAQAQSFNNGRELLAIKVTESQPAADSKTENTNQRADGEPELRMPFRAGTVVLCQQGNCSPTGYSHSLSSPNCLHALDFCNPTMKKLEVVAAAPGTVVKTFSEATPSDQNSGSGFGNYIKIDHGNGYFTFYAHLKSVLVNKGDRLKSGQVIGIAGNTGKAGNDQLHFSLHKGDPSIDGTCETVPMHDIVAADLNDQSDFKHVSSLDFKGAGSIISAKGHLYGSENNNHHDTVLGAPNHNLQNVLAHSNNNLKAFLNETAAVDKVLVERKSKSTQWAAGQFRQIVAEDKTNLTARYWLGAMLQDEKNKNAAAAACFKKIIAAKPESPRWLMPWCLLRLGEISAADGHSTQARRSLETALNYPSDDAAFASRCRNQLLQLK